MQMLSNNIATTNFTFAIRVVNSAPTGSIAVGAQFTDFRMACNNKTFYLSQ